MSRYAVSRRNRLALATHWREIKVRVDQDGENERYCTGCHEWWPMTEEFFGFLSTRGHFRSHCRVCEAAAERDRKARRKASAVATAIAG